MTTFNSSEQTKAWCHTQCPKVALPRGSRSSLQRSERSRETCTERESSSPHGQWCSRNFEVHGRLFCVLTGGCTRRSESPEIFFFQHVKTGHLVWPSQKSFRAMHTGLRREENANRFFQRAHTSTVHWDTCKDQSIAKGCYFLTCGGNALIINEFQL